MTGQGGWQPIESAPRDGGNMLPLIHNMLAGIETPQGRAAFVRATEFCEPREAESAAWEFDRLMGGPLALPSLLALASEGVPNSSPVVGELLAFILTRWWHHRFPNRKPPIWTLSA